MRAPARSGCRAGRLGAALILRPWTVECPQNWTARVDATLGEARLKSLRDCVARGRPFGSEQWVAATARRLGLEFTLRGPGRPRKETNQ
jgi:putative transposase